MTVTKRDGSLVAFDRGKIFDAILKAFRETDPENGTAIKTAKEIAFEIENMERDFTVEEIQDEVEKRLMNRRKYDVARSYMNYRYLHNMARDQYNTLMNAVSEKLSASNVVNQNANVDEHSFGGRVGEASSLVARKFALERCMCRKSRENHENNRIYIHDLDSYAVGSHNCLTIPFDDLLANGFNTRQTDVRPANSVNTAFQLVAVLFQLQSLQQFGGVSASHLDWTMVPYVRKSFSKHYADGMKYLWCQKWDRNSIDVAGTSIEDKVYWGNTEAAKYAMDMTQREVYQAVEAMYHNLKLWATQQ